MGARKWLKENVDRVANQSQKRRRGPDLGRLTDQNEGVLTAVDLVDPEIRCLSHSLFTKAKLTRLTSSVHSPPLITSGRPSSVPESSNTILCAEDGETHQTNAAIER